MNVKKNLYKFFSFLLLFLCLGSGIAKTASAQNASGLTIIPPKFELFGNPGDSVSEKIRVRNNSSAPKTYTLLIEDFTTSGEEGHVVLEEEENDDSYALAKWIEVSSKDIILQPNEEKAFNFIINIPKNAEPGGHYASILFQTGAEEEVPGGAKVAQRVGSLVLLRVSGNVTEDVQLEEFSTGGFQQKAPVNFLLRLKNNGNTHIQPQGTIVINNIFGKKVAELALTGRNVLPGAIRKMTTEWNDEGIMGIYTATMIATYGQQQLPITGVTKFAVLPTSVIIIGAVLAFSIIGLIVTLIVGRKRIGKVLRVIFKG